MEIIAGAPHASWGRRMWRGIKIVFVAFVLLFAAAVAWRMPHVVEEDHRRELDEKAARVLIGIADVDGSRVPPKPDANIAKATLIGIDTNKNRIRDDIEVMIYERLPIVATTSAEGFAAYGDANFRLRAAELQYAKSVEFTLREVTDLDSYTLAMERIHYGKMCIASTLLRTTDDVDAVTKQLNASAEIIALRIVDTPERLAAVGALEKFVARAATTTREWRCDIKYPG